MTWRQSKAHNFKKDLGFSLAEKRKPALLFAATTLLVVTTSPILSQSLHGTVRDSQGAPMGDAAVKLICIAAPVNSAQTNTGSDGSYRFLKVAPCGYQLVAQLGEWSSTPLSFSVAEASGEQDRDITLSKAVASHPKFEASGIRGLIDPGGYSAPANAAAASNLLSGMADINRVDTLNSTELDCSHETELLRSLSLNPHAAATNLALGEFYLHHHAAARALPYLETAQTEDSKTQQVRLDRAEALLTLERFSEARQILEESTTTQTNAQYNLLLARAYEGEGQFVEAAKQYRLQASLKPTDSAAFGIGYELLLAGHTSEATYEFEAGLQKFPRSIVLLIGCGVSEFLQGHTPIATDFFLRAADSDPLDTRPYPFLAALSGASPYASDRIRAVLQHHVDIAPNDPSGLVALAMVLSQHPAINLSNANRDVEAMLQHAVSMDPQLAAVHFELGSLYARGDRQLEAVRELSSAAQLDPNRGETHYRLALALRKIGRTEDSEREMRIFQQIHASNAREDQADLRRYLSVINRPMARTASTGECSQNPGSISVPR